MANPIKYNTNTESDALNSGDYWIGTGDVGKGPTSITGFVNGVDVPTNGYIVYSNPDGAEPQIRVASNDSELITITNRHFGQSFTTINQCFNYYQGQNDKMVLNRDYEGIVTDGLVLNVDAGFTPSYPKNGTIIYDLSVDGNNGTLTNGPSFSSGNGGIISFDGSNDVINLPSSNDITGDNLQNMTGEMWLRYTATGTMYAFSIKRSAATSTLFTITCNQDGGNQVGDLGFLVRNNANSSHQWITHSGGYNDGNWHHICGVVDGTNRILYIDGSLRSSSTGGIESVTGNTFPGTIGAFAAGNLSFNGDVSNVRFYRKSLSSTEVTQNYNAQKSRFGL